MTVDLWRDELGHLFRPTQWIALLLVVFKRFEIQTTKKMSIFVYIYVCIHAYVGSYWGLFSSSFAAWIATVWWYWCGLFVFEFTVDEKNSVHLECQVVYHLSSRWDSCEYVQRSKPGMSPYSYGKISKCYALMCVLFAFTAGILLWTKILFTVQFHW